MIKRQCRADISKQLRSMCCVDEIICNNLQNIWQGSITTTRSAQFNQDFTDTVVCGRRNQYSPNLLPLDSYTCLQVKFSSHSLSICMLPRNKKKVYKVSKSWNHSYGTCSLCSLPPTSLPSRLRDPLNMFSSNPSYSGCKPPFPCWCCVEDAM
jgi:hypothetical protein